jgi:hypothetical protein
MLKSCPTNTTRLGGCIARKKLSASVRASFLYCILSVSLLQSNYFKSVRCSHPLSVCIKCGLSINYLSRYVVH